MAQKIRDLRVNYRVVLIRDGVELDSIVILVHGEEDAKILAEHDLGPQNGVGLFDTNVEYRVEKV